MKKKQGTRVVNVKGHEYAVPEYLQRIDIDSHNTRGGTHGWQVRYGRPFKLFSDRGKPATSFRDAVRELKARLAADPPRPVSRVDLPLKRANTELPLGIYGPMKRVRKGRRAYAVFGVTLPQRKGPNRTKSVYIGTERTYAARYEEALERAKAIRAAAVKACGKRAASLDRLVPDEQGRPVRRRKASAPQGGLENGPA